VSEGGFEPPRPIGPLGPQPISVRGGTCHRLSSSAVSCVDAADLVCVVTSAGTGFTGSWGNSWGNA